MGNAEAQSWIRRWPVDTNSRSIFLAAPKPVQLLVMSRGCLGSSGAKNVSAILMGRLREAHEGWIPVPKLHLPSQESLVVFFRGEGSRIGGHGVYESEPNLTCFQDNLRSFTDKHVLPLLRQQFEVYIMADIKVLSGLEEEASKVLQCLYGKHLLQVRILPWLRGTDQLNSVMSNFDTCSLWLRERGFLNRCKGVYFFRIDVLLKSSGMEDCPKDHICFLWKTKQIIEQRKRRKEAKRQIYFFARTS